MANGSITVTPSGGVPPYTYLWNTVPPQTTATATGLTAGTYVVIVTDSVGTKATGSGTVQLIPCALTVSATPFLSTATASPANGTPPYTYSWNTTPIQTGATATGLSAGTYLVTVTDSRSCKNSGTTTITNTLNITTGVINSNNNTPTGSASATTTGGVAPYTYSWNSIPTQTGTTATGLTPATYTVTVRDSVGTTKTANAVVGNIACALGLSVTSTTSTATATPSGAVGAVTYSWNTTPVKTTASITGLSATTYIVTVIDSVGCISTGSTIIPNLLSVSVSTVGSNNNAPNGSATAIATGAFGPYTYSWNTTPVKTTASITGLTAGTYTVTVRDLYGTTKIASGTVTDIPCSLVLNITSSTNTATAMVSNGLIPYSYLWNTSPAQTGVTATGLSAGTYIVTVNDAFGCIISGLTSIGNTLGLTITKVNSNNNAPNGSATVIVTGGTAPYTYSWSTTPVKTTATITGLTAGTYTVIVTDSVGNFKTGIATILSVPCALNLSVTSGTTSATAVASNGLPPYTYVWNTTPVQTGTTATGLSGGTYIVTATDSVLCVVTGSTTIANSLALVTSTTGSTNNYINGAATVTPSGGVAPYTYSWNTTPVKTTQTITGLTAGTYTVTVTDSLGNTKTANAVVNLLSCTVAVVVTSGASSATAVASSGLPPYTYSWNSVPTQTGATATGLSGRTYIVTVKDLANCTITGSTVVPNTLNVTTTTVGSNNNTPTGSASATTTGGVAPYTYSWNTTPVKTTASITGLTAGTYTVTVRDSVGNIKTANAVVGVLGCTVAVVVTSGASSATATASSGTGPYKYSWNSVPTQTGATATGLSGRTYIVTVTDSVNCVITGSTVVPNTLNVTTTTINSNNNTPNGSASATTTGGVGAVTYSWNTTPVKTTASITGLTAGTYTVTVRDSVGNIKTANAIITNIPCALTVAVTSTVSTATATPSNQIGAVTYSWNTTPVKTTQTITGLPAGTYIATVKDSVNCTVTGSTTIANTLALVTSTTGSSINTPTGAATVSTTGGVAPYTYSWNTTPVKTTQTITSLSARTYVVTVTDSVGNTKTANAVVGTVACNLAVVVTSGASSATAVASNGTGPYKYSWNSVPIQTGATATGLSGRTYIVTVTDSVLCVVTGSTIIPNTLVLSVSTVNSNNNTPNGSATVTVTGGVGAVTYSWNTTPVQTTQTATGLTPATYTVTVRDSVGNTKTANAAITNIPCALALSVTSTIVSGTSSRANLIYEGTFEGATPFANIIPQSCTPDEISQSTDFARVGTNSAKVVLNKTDCDVGGSRRSEMNRSSTSEPAGDFERWYGVSFYLPASWAIDTAPEVVMQWHQYTGTASPPIALWIQNGRWGMAYSGTNTTDLGATVNGVWTDWVFHMQWSATASGLFEAWKNGVKVITQTGSNMPVDTHGPYLKTGVYKWYWKDYPTLSQTTQRIIYIDELREGSELATYNDVAPGPVSANTGTATANPSGGIAPYSYSWNTNPVKITQTATGLSAGTYTVTVTDSVNCIKTGSTIVSGASSFTLTTAKVDANNTQSNGSATVTVNNGVGPFTYSWNSIPVQTTATATGLSARTYVVTVTDNIGTQKTASVVISGIPCTLTVAVSSTTSTATATPSGAVGAVTYSWNTTPVKTTQTITGLAAGTYRATVTDSVNCVATGSTTISAAPVARANLILELKFESATPFAGVNPQSCTTNEISQSTDFARVGTHSAKVIVNKTDCLVGGSTRSEMNRSSTSEPAGATQRWYGISYYLTPAWISDVAPEAICQWHEYSSTASPHFALWSLNGHFWIAYDGAATVDLGAYPIGVWTDFVFHMNWDTTASGNFNAWMNGVQVVTNKVGANMPVDSFNPYWKFGIYKWPWAHGQTSNTTQRLIYIDEVREGNASATYYDVAPGNY